GYSDAESHSALIRYRITVRIGSILTYSNNDEQPPPITTAEGNEEQHVDEILCARSVKRGRGLQRLVLVKWKGFADPTWEPLQALQETEALDKYELLYGNALTNDGPLKATRSERVRPDNRATPPIEGIGSSEMPIIFPTDPVDVSLIQSARRNGIPPPRKRTRLMKPIPPPGTRHCNCNKGCSTRSCRCRKDGRSCSIYCHGRSCSCENMGNSEPTEHYSPPGVPDAASSTGDLSELIRKREYLQQQMMANEATLHELEGHRSNGVLTIAYPETVLTPQEVTFDLRAVNNRRAILNTHSQPPWRIIEIEDAEVNENIDNNEGEFR
ncbi:hypothetical protein K3495_g15196, partial [Podosphaera aphanis]